MNQDTKQLLNSLPRPHRKQVEKIVMRFANRHDDAGILPQELDQVYRDVIAAVQLQAYFPTNLIPEIHNWEQAQHYALFTSPQFAY